MLFDTVKVKPPIIIGSIFMLFLIYRQTFLKDFKRDFRNFTVCFIWT